MEEVTTWVGASLLAVEVIGRGPDILRFTEEAERTLDVKAFRMALRRAERNTWMAARRIDDDEEKKKKKEVRDERFYNDSIV